MNDWDDAEHRVENARRLFEQRKWRQAIAQLRAAAAINPDNAVWLFNMGRALDEMERFDEAIEAYRHTLEVEPDDIEALNHLGVDLSRTSRHQEALEIFARIETLDASYEQSYCNRIITYARLGDHEKAEEMFYLARLYKEDCPLCYYNIGCSLQSRGLYDKAIYCWQKTLDLDDRHPQIHLRLAEAYRGKRKLERARQHYLAELRRQPGDTDTLLDLGSLLLEMDHVEEAGEKFRRAIELAPERPAGYYFHGRWLLEYGSRQQALQEFAQVLRLDPTFAGAHLALARIHHAGGDRAACCRHLCCEHSLQPEDPQILLELSNLLMDNDQPLLAVSCLKRLTAVEPASAIAWQNLAVANFLAARYDDGIDASRAALERDPRHLMAMYNLAVAYEQLGNYDEAQTWVRRGLSIDPADAALQRLDFRLRVLRLKRRLQDRARRVARFMLHRLTRRPLGKS